MVENNPEKLVQRTLDQELKRAPQKSQEVFGPAVKLSPTGLPIYESDESDNDLRRRLQQRSKKKLASSSNNTDAYFKDQLDAAQGTKRGAIGLARYRKARLNK